jgi:hypothetical protein
MPSARIVLISVCASCNRLASMAYLRRSRHLFSEIRFFLALPCGPTRALRGAWG